MVLPFPEVWTALLVAWDEWSGTPWSGLQFIAARDALLIFTGLLALAVLCLLVGLARRGSRKARLALPSLVPVGRRSGLAWVRHLPAVLFIAGLPLFAIALADPQTGFTREEVSYPGRRIALVVDGSTSMIMQFQSRVERQGMSTFFTAIAATEAFIRRRMDGPYRDLVALIQFGNFAYVVTPFTNDYENVLLSTRLVGDPREWARFPDWGTTIAEGIDQAMQLFQAFGFTEAAGNLMIVITDGRDSSLSEGNPLERVVATARSSSIPVYMLRTAYNLPEGRVVQDPLWKAAVERTGGRFFAAYDDASIERALDEIDKLSPGRIDTRQYSVQRPRFAGWALAAAALWLLAAALKLGAGVFRTVS
jgi:hypothetical protein